MKTQLTEYEQCVGKTIESVYETDYCVFFKFQDESFIVLSGDDEGIYIHIPSWVNDEYVKAGVMTQADLDEHERVQKVKRKAENAEWAKREKENRRGYYQSLLNQLHRVETAEASDYITGEPEHCEAIKAKVIQDIKLQLGPLEEEFGPTA